MFKFSLVLRFAVVAGFAAVSANATADSVTVGGMTFTCTNTCNVSNGPNGSIRVRDCCGGRVSIRLQPTQQ